MCVLPSCIEERNTTFYIVASYYELWKADSHKVFYKAKENATKVEDADIISGSLSSPSPAYTREKLVLNIQDRDDISVYAIIAKVHSTLD